MARTPKRIDLRRATAVLAEPGGEQVAMAQVARELGIAKPTLYRLAHSKEALVRACADAEGERLLDYLHAAFARSLDAPPEERLAAGLAAVFRYARESPAGLRLLFEHRAPASRAAVRRVEDRLRDLLRREARQAGATLPHPELLAAGLLALAAASAGRALADGEDWDPDAFAAWLGARAGGGSF